MATITAHLVNASDGTHAAGVGVSLTLLSPDGSRSPVLELVTDHEGRFKMEVDRANGHADDAYELVISAARYFSARGFQRAGLQVVDDVVVRLKMPEPQARYHFPITLAPNYMSVWWSA